LEEQNGGGISSGIFYGMRKRDFPVFYDNVLFHRDDYERAVKLVGLQVAYISGLQG
jgi:hypothetical protein